MHCINKGYVVAKQNPIISMTTHCYINKQSTELQVRADFLHYWKCYILLITLVLVIYIPDVYMCPYPMAFSPHASGIHISQITCIYVKTIVCVCVCVRACMRVHACACVHVWVPAFVCVFICICVYIYVCMHASMCVCTHTCIMCICVYDIYVCSLLACNV